MARYKYFGENIEPSCEYCKYGKLSMDKKMILCQHKGILVELLACRRFIYDPLKRKPKRQMALPKFDKSDFEL
ncbi:MAG: hypothetical protein RSD67_02895 [Oscillospiraceae bacterium]